MNKRSILFALFGGIAAGLSSIPSGNERVMTGHLILMSLSTLPIFLAGLSGGMRAGFISALLATSISTSLSGLNGVFFGLIMAIPAAMLVIMAVMPINFMASPSLLLRKSLRMSKIRTLFGKSGSDYIEVPSGSLMLLCLITMGWTVFIIGSLLVLQGEPNPEKTLTELLQRIIPTSAIPSMPENQEKTAALMISFMARFPAMMILGWMMCLAFNGILAQGLLMRFNHNLRTAPDIGNIGFPPWFSWLGLALMAMTLLSEVESVLPLLQQSLPASLLRLLPGASDADEKWILPNNGLAAFAWVGYLARNLLLIQMTGFFVTGLAVVHFLSRKRPYRIFVLTMYYALAILVPWVMFATNLIGLIEPWAKLRRRFV